MLKEIHSALKKRLGKSSEIIDLEPYLQLEKWQEEFWRSMKDADLEASCTFAAHTFYQRFLSHISEVFSFLDDLGSLFKIIEKAQEEYVPQGPPCSPLTASYFYYWVLYDASTEETGTLTEYFLKSSFSSAIISEWIPGLKEASQSRMGIYENKGAKNGLIHFQEILTNRDFYSICPAGYQGEKNDLCLIRIMPSLFPEDANVVVTTPYILRDFDKKTWINFYLRNEISEKNIDQFMKYGPSINYWNEFIFLSYANHSEDHINLVGIPDLKGTKPHE